MNNLAAIIPADFGKVDLGGMFHQAGQFVTETTGTVMQSFSAAAFRVQAANQTPKQMIDNLVASNPDKLSGLGELAKADESFAGALHEAVVNDATLAKGIVEISNTAGGGDFLNQLENALRNPELRGDLALGLQNMAQQDAITFDNLKQLTEAVNLYDPADLEASNQRVIDAYASLGIPEENALRAIRDGQMNAAKEFLHDLFNNPDEAFGKLGNFIEGLGLPPEIGQFIAGLLPQIQSLVAAMPEAMGNVFAPHVAFYEEHIDPWVDKTMAEGAQNMAQSATPSPGLT
jgi:hypothetical protein